MGYHWCEVMATKSPAPDTVLHLVKCNCLKSRCLTNRCTCRNAELNCTELCGCVNDDDVCANYEDDEDKNSDSGVDSEVDEGGQDDE